MSKLRVRVKGREGDMLLVKNLRRGPLRPTPKRVLVDVVIGLSFRAQAPDGTIAKEMIEDVTQNDAGKLIDVTP